MNTPRAVIVGVGIDHGGAENRLHRVSQHLFGGGARLALFRVPDDAKGSDIVDLGWHGGFTSYPRAIMRLRKHLREQTYDVAISFGLFPSAVLTFARVGLSRRPACTVMEITRPKAAERELTFVRKILYAALRRFIYAFADAIGVNSNAGLEECVEHFGADRSKTHRVHNIVDRIESPPVMHATPSANLQIFRVSTAARFVQLKRLDTLLAAVSLLPSELRWELYLIGDGPERSNLESQALLSGVAERVRFLGWRSDVTQIVASCQAYVLCSRYEGFSNGALEAMAMGIPVVTSYCSSDARDMVRLGAALGHEVGDADGLSKQLLLLMQDPSLASAVRMKGLDYARAFAPSRAIKGYEFVVLEAIRRKSQALRESR